MKNKIISGLVWTIVWALLMYIWFNFHFIWKDNHQNPPQNNINSEMTDDRLEKISERTGLSKE